MPTGAARPSEQRRSPAVLTPRSVDFPRWYADVVAKAELADNGPVRGTMVIRPYGYALWERMQAELDARIRATGARNAYFPLFIPESYLRREAEHVEGFSPELAVVTHAGGKQLDEPVVVRPTSETVIGEYLGRWVQSHRDLPLLLNQWANVVRWELRPRIFLRTTEFLWQEGHTAHATAADATAFARRILDDVYADFMEQVLAIPVVRGRKTARERFAGAVNTLALEAMTGDGRALQLATSHELGQNFARAFGIDFSDANGVRQLAHTTSWGSSTRLIGGLIMCHGDDSGLRIPPALAAVQVLVTVVRSDPDVDRTARALLAELGSTEIRVELDDRVDIPYGRRAVDAELKGYPLRVELGPRDLARAAATVVRRITGGRTTVPLGSVAQFVSDALVEDQAALMAEATRARDERTVSVATVGEAAEAAATGWARIPWATLGEQGEAELAAGGITVRCLTRPDGLAPDTADEPGLLAVLARAY